VENTVRVKKVSSETDLNKAFVIRMRVFVKEQGVPAEMELDRDDKDAIHFLATIVKKPVGTARLIMRHGNAKIGRMAVLKSWRRRGVGTTLLKRAVVVPGDWARGRFICTLKCRSSVFMKPWAFARLVMFSTKPEFRIER
jgi:predicted GNAT family N-acyltransferase